MMRRGMTLVELMVAIAAFTGVMVVSLGVMMMGSRTFATVQSRADAERDIRLAMGDISREASRAIAATMAVSTNTTDYRWALWFQTDMNSATGTPQQLGDPIQAVVDAGGAALPQRYVLYYVARMDPAEHQQRYGYLCSSYPGGSSADPGAGPDTMCPHKWLIKKEIYLMSGKTHDQNDNLGLQGTVKTATNLAAMETDTPRTEVGLTHQGETFTANSEIHTARVLAQNVVSFEVARLTYPSPLGSAPVQNATGSVLQVHLRLLKADQVAKNLTLGNTPAYGGGVPPTAAGVPMVPMNLTVTPPTMASTTDPSLQPYTVDLETQVVPRN